MFLFLHLLLIFVKFSSCIVYLDLKNNYISGGIVVHHGYFFELGVYRLFLGEYDPISEIKFGDYTILPYEEDTENKVSFMVEYFECPSIKFTVVHVTSEDVKNVKTYYTLNYKIDNGYIVQVDRYPTYVLNSKIRLSLDINEDSIKHPFILTTESQQDEYKVTKHEIVDRYRGIYLDGKEAPHYGLGNIYDSGAKGLFGYGIFNCILEDSHNIIVKRGPKSSLMIANLNVYNLYFEKIINNSIEYWYYNGIAKSLNRTARARAVTIKNKIKIKRKLIGVVTLDVLEDVSPEYFQIDRTDGVLGPMKYRVYYHKYSSTGIQFIMDSSLDNLKIYVPSNSENVETVEVLNENGDTYVIISKVSMIYPNTKGLDIFKKKPNYRSYIMLDQVDNFKMMENLVNMYPIHLSINMDDFSKRIYKNVRLNDDIFNFNYFFINEYFNEDELLSKYIFGTISEINPYEDGNIPCEKTRREYRLIRNGLNCQEFLIRNPLEQKPMDPLLYEVYVPVT